MDELTLVRGIGDALEALVDHGPLGPQDRIDLWVSLREMSESFRAVVRALEEEATEAAMELSGGQTKVPVRTRFATVMVKRKPGTTKVNGWALLGALGDHYANPRTGELELAVPVRVLRGVIPACGVDDFTSAKFNVSGLKGQRLQIAGREVELEELTQTGGWTEQIVLAGRGEGEP